MTLRRVRSLGLVLAVLLLGACAAGGGKLQEAGVATVFDLELKSTLDWSRIKTARQETWTIDGTPLNMLQIFSKVKPDEHVFQLGKKTRDRPDGPWYRSGMRPDELSAVIADALTQGAWANVTVSALRPATFGPVNGMRFDVLLDNPSGLRYGGTVATAEYDDSLTVLIWMAPLEHYHPRDAAAVGQMLDGLVVKPPAPKKK